MRSAALMVRPALAALFMAALFTAVAPPARADCPNHDECACSEKVVRCRDGYATCEEACLGGVNPKHSAHLKRLRERTRQSAWREKVRADGRAALAAKDWDRAAAIYEEALKTEPKNQEFRNGVDTARRGRELEKQDAATRPVKEGLLAGAVERMTAALRAIPPPPAAEVHLDFAEPTDGTLPVAAAADLRSGIAAAKAGNLVAAGDAFHNARVAAPEAPVVFLDAGLAEARRPGRELRAIAWLGAYLTIRPDAPDATAVRREINALQARADVAALAHARGVLAAAENDGSGFVPSQVMRDLADALIRVGDLHGADALLRQADAPLARTPIHLALAEAKLRAGDPAGARADVAEIRRSTVATTSPVETLNELCRLAEAQHAAGDLQGTRESLATAALAVRRINRRSIVGVRSLVALAHGQTATGDPVQGRRTRELAMKSASSLSRNVRPLLMSEVAAAMADAGDVDAARAAADQMNEPFYRGMVYISIADSQGRRKELDAARRAADAAPENMRAQALTVVANAQIVAGRADVARSTLGEAADLAAKIDSPLDRTMAQVGIASYQVKSGDTAAARKTLAAARRSQKKIPERNESDLKDPGRDQRLAAEAIRERELEIDWKERPWTAWLYHLDGALNTTPFPDPALYVQGLQGAVADPNRYLTMLLDVTRAVTKERALIDQMLAGGAPY